MSNDNFGFPASINNLPEKYKIAIDSVSDERNNGDGWWILLNEPFFNTQLECRTIHESRLSTCIKILKGCVDNPVTKAQYFDKFINKQS